jgi:hypothetical protein
VPVIEEAPVVTIIVKPESADCRAGARNPAASRHFG